MNYQKLDDMNYKKFSIVEDEGKAKSRLTLYVNDQNKIYLEICQDDEPEDMYSRQTIVFNLEDAIALQGELEELIEALKTIDEHLQIQRAIAEETETITPSWLQREKQPKQIALTAK